MSVYLLNIEKEKDGETWVNTWGLFIPGNTYSETDLSALIGQGAVDWNDETKTNPLSGSSYLGNGSMLAAVIGFERLMHFSPITISNIYASDGQKNTTMYFSRPVALPCLKDLGTAPESSIAPGNVCLQIDRQPAVLSARPGRLFMRACLLDEDVAFRGIGAVGWVTDAQKLVVRAYLEGAMTDSFLDTWTFAQNPSGHHIAIPHYSSTTGSVTGGAAIGGLSVNAPVSRQVKGGRRRTTSPG